MGGRIINRPKSVNRLALPRVGTIKIGYKDERGLPRSTDYFLAAGKYESLFRKEYGDRPKTIQIVFPSDEPEQVCNERYEYRDDDGRLLATGDGRDFQVWDGNKYIELNSEEYPNLMASIEKRYPNKQYRKTGEGWNIILTLNFIIPCVRGIAGVWKFSTKGTASTIPQIRDVFDAVLQSKGYVRGIIFDLNVEYAKSQKPGNMSRYPVVSMVPNESEENILRIKSACKSVIDENKVLSLQQKQEQSTTCQTEKS